MTELPIYIATLITLTCIGYLVYRLVTKQFTLSILNKCSVIAILSYSLAVNVVMFDIRAMSKVHELSKFCEAGTLMYVLKYQPEVRGTEKVRRIKEMGNACLDISVGYSNRN